MMNLNLELVTQKQGVSDTHKQLVLAVIGVGILLRLLFWGIHPPNWRLHAVFTPLDTSFFNYLANFQGYKPSRLPIFDVLSALLYVPLRPVLGVKALSAFTVLSSIGSLPLFYGFARRLFDRDVALFGLMLFALHPQALVLVGEGYPEAAGVAFAVASVYAITRGQDSGALRWYVYAGITGTLSYLIFIPGVLFAVVTNVYVYLLNTEINGLRSILPGWPSTLYAVVPSIFGVAYLWFGPVFRVTGRVGSVEEIIFVTEAYSTAERIIRYVGYTYVDFWWHFPGFDHERHILQLFAGIKAVIGPLFPVYLGGWIVITATLTVGILIGAIVAIRRRTLETGYVLTWLLFYAVAWNAKNLNWVGSFNTRHVYHFFPAVCLLFGLGVVWVIRRADTSSFTKFTAQRWLQSYMKIEIKTLVLAVFAVLFAILIVNAAGQGVIDTQKHQITYQDPVQQVTNVAEKKDTVAVTNRRLYDYMLIYTDGHYRPVILTKNDEQKRATKVRTSIADVRVGDPTEINSLGIDYLLVNNFACREIKSDEEALINSAVSNGGTIVYDQTTLREQFRCSEYRTIIVKFDDNHDTL